MHILTFGVESVLCYMCITSAMLDGNRYPILFVEDVTLNLKPPGLWFNILEIFSFAEQYVLLTTQLEYEKLEAQVEAKLDALLKATQEVQMCCIFATLL